MVTTTIPKIFGEQFSGNVGGGAVPSGTYYKSTIGFRANTLLIWNNSPVTYSVRDTPKGQQFAIIPPFFSMSVALPNTTSLALVGDGTAPFTTSTLQFQLQTAALGAPFAGQFGPGAWGSGAVPNVLTPVNPGDQLLAWQIQQIINLLTGVMTGQVVTIHNELILTGPSGGLQLNDQDAIGGDNFILVVSGGQLLFQASATGINPFAISEVGQAQLKGSSAGLQVFDTDGVTNDNFNIFERNSFLTFQGQVNGVLQNAAALNENGSFSVIGPGAELRATDEAAVAADFSWYNSSAGVLANVCFRIFDYNLNADILAIGSGAPTDTVSATRLNVTVGPDAQPLTNWTFVAPDSGVTASGTGNQVQTGIHLSNLPSNNVTAVMLLVTWSSTAAGDQVTLAHLSIEPLSFIQVTQVANRVIAATTSLRTRQITQQILYTVTAVGTWTLGLTVLAYYEPT